MNMQMFLNNIEQVIARHIKDRLATTKAHKLGFNLEYGLAICKFQIETISREG
jgi:hypothetical protein